LNQSQIRFIENNLQLLNREIANRLDMKEWTLKRFMRANQLRRTEDQLLQIKQRVCAERIADRNPNWKGGISKNNYHYKLIQKERYPERIKARELVGQAKKKGILKPEPCGICGTYELIEAHHPDYSRPLKVEWYCREHHREIDKTSNRMSDARRVNYST